MNRIIAAVLLFSLCAGLVGCAQDSQNISDPVSFYYRRSELAYGAADSVILAETRDAAGQKDATFTILNEYLKGPQSEEYLSPFPQGTELQRVVVTEKVAIVILSDQIASLNGLDLYIACACITLTLIDLTGTQTVYIHAENRTLNGETSVVMDKDCLLLLDDSATKPAT